MSHDAEEYRPPYEGVDHNELWRSLMTPNGDPEQVDGLAAVWSNPVKSTLDDFVFDLDRDLTDLMAYWSEKSAGGAEYKRRMDLVVRFADELSADVGTIKGNLDTWSAALRTAQEQAPDPDDTDDSGRTIAGATIGAAIAGPAGALVGGLIGHEQDEEQREEAHDKMVAIIAMLAMQYDLNNAISDPPPLPPVDLPDTMAGEPVLVPGGDPVPTAEGFAPDPGAGDPVPDTAAPDGTGPDGVPNGSEGDGGGAGYLLGAGPGTMTGVSAGATGGLGLGGTAPSALTGSSGGTHGLLGGTAAGMRPGGLIGSGRDHGSLASAKGAGPAGRTATGEAGRTQPPPKTNRGVVRADDDEPEDGDGYDTWLTEDDIVWTAEDDAPPRLVATAPPAEAPVKPPVVDVEPPDPERLSAAAVTGGEPARPDPDDPPDAYAPGRAPTAGGVRGAPRPPAGH